MTGVQTCALPISIDTIVISTRKWRQKGIDSVQANLTTGLALKVNIADTASMLSTYFRKVDTASLSNRINLKANINSPTFTGTVGGITQSMVGLGNVTNESKATMFTNATFTGTFATAAGAIGNASLANGAVANLSGTNTGDQTTITGNAGTATALQTARTIGTTTGDATSAGSTFNGTANNTNALTLATVNSNVGTFTNSTITVNGKGLITAASSGTGVGTVTSVAALTLGTSGTDLSSTVANSTTTPVITLNVPTASATNRGALSSADWTTFNSKQSTITLTTTGTSGAATFSANTLNIPQYQGVISNPVTGTGTTNYVPKFTSSTAISNSVIYASATNVGISNTSPLNKLHITQGTDTDYPTLGTGKGALFIAGDNNLFGLYIGINTSDGNSYMQVMRNNAATAYNLILQPVGGSVGIGTTTPAASSLLDVTSTTKGFLPPRMTTTQINAISSPAAGLVVYNTTLAVLCFYDGTGWKKVTHTAM